jgi:subtilisin family serine protease
MSRPALFTACTTAAVALTSLTIGIGSARAADADAADAQRVLVAVREPAAVETVAHRADQLGAEVTASVPASSTVAVEATPQELHRLRASDDVVAITRDIPLEVALDESVPLVGANKTRAAGYDGGGRAVAIIDTGVQSDHPFLDGRVVDGACFSSSGDCPNGQATQTGIAGGEPCDFAQDCFHGTHVAGIVAGSNASFTGVAPDASILSINVASAEDGCGLAPCLMIWASDIMAALQQVYDWHDSYDIAAVNMSLGGGAYSGSNCDSSELAPYLKPLIQDLRGVGIPTVIAAGNAGSKTQTSFPACLSNAVAVGATTKTNTVAAYSNSSAAVDMWAPGSGIFSSAPTNLGGSGYKTASGTSMATPHVAGAFAVVDELLPNATLSTKQARIVSTGPTITDTRNQLRRHRLRLTNDITPPQTRLTSVPSATVHSAKVSFWFTTGTTGATFTCQVDSGAWRSCAAPTARSVSKGTHTFRVRGRDAAGNLDTTPATRTWRYAP